MIRNPLFAGAWVLAAIIAVSPAAQGQTTYTWNGGGTDDNWSTGANWGGTAPAADPVNPPLIVLGGNTRLTNVLDLLAGSGGGSFDVNSLTFASGAGSFVVNPTATNVTTLRIGAGGVTVSNNNNQTFAAPIALSANQTWTNSGSGTFTMSGGLSLAGNTLTVAGAGATRLTGPVAGGGGLTNNSSQSLLVSGNVDLTAGGLTVAGTGAAQLTGVLSGTGGLTKSGTGVATLSGANTFGGPVAVNAGTLVVSRPTGGATPLGTGTVTLNGGTVSFRGGAGTPVNLTAASFNFDTISSATDFFSPYPFGVNKSLDATGDGNGDGFPDGFVFYEANAGTGGRGFPSGGTIVSAANPLTTYQMQPYGNNGVTVNNTRQLNNNDAEGGGNTGTLTLTAGGKYQVVSILTTGGGGAVSYRARLNFSDGSFTDVDLNSPDWFNNSPFVITNLDRMSRTGTPANATNNPRLYAQDIGLSATDQGKTLVSIGLTRLSGGRLNVYGVSGVSPNDGPTSYANPVAVTADSTIDLVNTGSLVLGPLSIGTNTLSTAGPSNGFLAFSSTSLTGNPTFSVANQTLTLGALDFNSAARTVTKSGVGRMVLDSAAVNATATNTLAVTAGTATVSNATALGTAPNVSVTGGTANLGPIAALTNLTTSGGATNLNSVATIANATVNGGTVNLGGATAAGQLSGTGGTVALGSNSLTLGSANANNAFAGTITGAGAVTKVGSGTQTLSGANTYAGGTTISAGKVVAPLPGTIGTGAVTLSDGTALSIGGTPGATVTGFGGNGTGWSLQGTENGVAGSPPTVSGDVLTITTATNSLARTAWFNTKVPTAPFIATFKYSNQNGGNPADGAAFVFQNTSGTVIGAPGGGLGYGGIGSSVALGINIYDPNTRGIRLFTNGTVTTPFNPTGTVNLLNSGPGNEVTFTLDYDGTSVDLTMTQGANTFTALDQPLNLAAIGSTAWIGFTGGTGGLNAAQLISNFNLTVLPRSNYANAVNVSTSASAAISPIVATNVTTFAMGPLAMGAGSTLNLSPDATSSLADANYNLTLGATALAGQATFNVGNNGTGVGSLTLGALSDGGTARTIIKEGPGTLVLSAAAASLIDGTVVNVNNGTLRPTNATALGNLAAVALASGSNLSLGANQTVGALSGTGNVALNGNTLTIGSTNNLNPTFAGVIADGTAAGGLTKAGTGTLTLSGANTYSGATTINAGVLQLGSATGLSSNTTVTFPTASTGTLRLNGNSVAVNGLSGPAGTVENASATAAALTVGGSTATTFGGVIQDGAGAGALTLVKAGTGALTLAGANTYTGGTTISGGKLVIGAPGALPDTGTVTIALNGTLSTAGGAGGAGVSETAGTLKTTGSTIELGTGVHTLTFSGLAPLGDLTSSPVITGWTGVKYTSGTQGRIIINNLGSDPNTVYATWLSNVNFTNVSDTGLGGYFLATGGPAGQFELVPVPEPGAVLGFAAAGLAGLGLIRRRFRRKAEVVAAA